jgi:hypothetical protein
MLAIDIADGHDLHAFIREDGAQIARPLPSYTVAGETDLPIRRNGTSTPQHGGWKDKWKRGLEKLTA